MATDVGTIVKLLLSTIVKVSSKNTHFKMSSSDDLPSDIENELTMLCQTLRHKNQEENTKKRLNVTKNCAVKKG